MVNYVHKILVKILTVHASSITPVIEPISALSILSIHLSNDKHQEVPDELCGTNYGDKFPVKLMATIPDNVTLTLHKVKFLQKTPGNFNRANVTVQFLYG